MKRNTLLCVIRRLLIICIASIIFPGYSMAQQMPEQFREKFTNSFPIRSDQHLEIKAYADKLLQEGIKESLASFKPDYFSIEDYQNSLYPYRERVGKFFGYPPPKSVEGNIVKFVKVGEDINCTIYRVWIEVIERVNAYGIYMVPKNIKGEAPLIIAQHGGGGNPEAICDLDTRINYHSFGPEAVKRGYIVWAPALAMRCGYCEDPDIQGASREILDQKLKFAGTSIIGVELQKIIESTRTLIRNRPEIDANRIGMTGLSWGGFFTMYTTAVCPFIKVAVPSGYFRGTEPELNRAVSGESKTAADRNLFQGTGHFQVVGLICPRPCMVQIGATDTLFNMEEAREESARASEFYKKLGISDRYEFNVHPAGHEFDIPNLFRFFDKHLKPISDIR
jgi:dienelactone hydrolase